MDQSVSIILRVVVAFALALGGGAISATISLSHERLCALISLAAGTLLGVTLFAIIPETTALLHWWGLLIALGSGYIVFLLISKYVYHVCPACAASHFDEATTHRFSEIASALIVALAIHSTMDGIALAAGHEMQHAHHDESRAAIALHPSGLPGEELDRHDGLDLSLVAAVCVHKLPEGLALGALLLGAGFRKGKMLAWVAAVESTTILGGIIGLVAIPASNSQQHAFWLAAALAHAGGGFLFLATHAVLGEMMKHGKKLVLSNFLAGVAIIGLLHWALHRA